MTFREKLMQEHPEEVRKYFGGGCYGCPENYGYELRSSCLYKEAYHDCCVDCQVCWDREIPENNTAPAEEKKGENKMAIRKNIIKAALAEKVSDYLSDDVIEEAIFDAIGNLDLSDTIGMALDDAVQRELNTTIDSMIDDVVSECIADVISDIFE